MLFITANESFPKINFTAALLNSANPSTGKYSWFNVISLANCCSTVLTIGNTQGFPLSSLYAFFRKNILK